MILPEVYWVALEGIIGAGKTYLLSKIENEIEKETLPFSCLTVNEFLDDYTTFQSFNPLALAYDNPRANAAISQLHIIECLNQRFQEKVINCLREKQNAWKNDTLVIISDRSLYSPLVFTQALHNEGVFNRFVYDYIMENALKKACQTVNALSLKLDGVYFLDVSVPVCMKRLQDRGRMYEMHGGVSTEHQQMLDLLYISHLAKLSQRGTVVMKSQEPSVEDFVDFIKLVIGRKQQETNKTQCDAKKTVS